ncbi:restriction endonuclease subunit M [Cylindrospermopsis raciborskii S07]|uniref:type I restriction-modification system subunit M n=1 Tax=Cylindrospermopsis raciborskii TaxID=77022 RepID=UPI000C9E797F|nr:class I SAM-dependent DNA methyltransferase [Cylindrospermopsis raciborskii]PNK01768.1 restriction endonuclease subunit M [Cylindrospermopsis raciborskii S07]PNK02082.1 restriction endonuclease subunit M [Cylindrospermopsis raciborskii S10]PNK02968.1 restriction endonuclease subunit M [Cylindrospermopsis raciborskii S14]PNK12239.1 restriction endonuclease subunit M [Cylindrospermopsis raciborskii S05]PNK13139.1 restriction endonuclease subunit M [Cylindrospermopsis raciborskii S06]
MQNFGEKVNFIWSIADLIRDTFKRGKYQDVILPFTVLRRLDCVLQPTKVEVLEAYDHYKNKLDNLDSFLCKKSGFAFYNSAPYDFQKLLDDPKHLAANLKLYINSFSANMREVLEKFDFPNTIDKLEQSELLFLVTERFKNIDLHPDKVSNLEMGYIFEELIRKFNEALDENPGEHFTPREVIQLMVNLIFAQDKAQLSQEYINRTVCDPCCGSGGMLTIAKDRILELNSKAQVFLFGQEVNPETFAVCKSDLYMKSIDGKDAENIKFGSTLSHDQHSDRTFDYLLANPPYGKDWKRDKDAVEAEAQKPGGRFSAGTPRISDGQLLFLQHMLSRMKPVEQGGSRVAIVMNGSPLFTGDAGSGESEIRRWILENDWLEAIAALPEQLFYNTGIATYIWVLTNHKSPERKGKVQLINASEFWIPMRKSLGSKRREVSSQYIEEITRIFQSFESSEVSKIFDTQDFGYRKITVERPLRLNFQASPERIVRIKEQPGFISLAVSKKKSAEVKATEEQAGRKQQRLIWDMLYNLPDTLYKDRDQFEKVLKKAIKSQGLTIGAPVYKAILAALSERDDTGKVCGDKQGHPEADSELRDTENVPLKEDIREYFQREVAPHVSDAWISESVRDVKDGEIGKVGYEINFNRYFYKYEPPRALEEIEAEIKAIEGDILEMLREVAG